MKRCFQIRFDLVMGVNEVNGDAQVNAREEMDKQV